MSTRISALEFARYRGFRDPQSARLGRLNLVYGENNSGKSALVRLPQLLASSRTGSSGVNLAAPFLKGAGFRDVRWRGALPAEDDPDMVIGVTLSSGARWRWTIRWLDVESTADIRKVEIFENENSTILERQGSSRGGRYTRSDGTATDVVFDGLLPRTGVDTLFDHHQDSLNA